MGPRREGAAADAVGHLMNHGQLRRRTTKLQSAVGDSHSMGAHGGSGSCSRRARVRTSRQQPNYYSPRLYTQDSTAKCIGGKTTLETLEFETT